MVPGGRTPKTATFAQALASLKRQGSSLLLVGPAYEEAHLRASRRLLGSAEEDTQRSRLLVVTDGTTSPERRLEGVASESVRTLTYEAPTRRGATAKAGTQSAPGSTLSTEESHPDLASLCQRIDEAVEEIAADRGGLDPAELRVCFDSLVPLLETFEEREVFTFLHALTGATREAGAMAHYHLPVPVDDPLVRTITPLFDAVIELRVTPDGVQQRWRLTDEDVVTEWLSV